MKRTISFILVCCMLVLMLPASSVKVTAAVPSIEEILNDYHSKAFEAQASGESGGVSTYALRSGGSSKTLEQETVDTLNAAGYEAYNVTADNYDALESALHTNFADMGLDPNCSYIIVLSGEESENGTNSNSRAIDKPAYDNFDGDGGFTFTYTQDGVTYTMRQVTVTSVDDTRLRKSDAVKVSEIGNAPSLVSQILSATIIAGIDAMCTFPIGTITQLIGQAIVNDNYTIDASALTVQAAVSWTRKYIQILDENNNSWHSAHYSSSYVAKARCAGYRYSSTTGEPYWFEGVERSITEYSGYYNDLAYREEQAVAAFTVQQTMSNPVGNARFFLIGPEEVGIGKDAEPFLTFSEWTGTIYLPTD